MKKTAKIIFWILAIAIVLYALFLFLTPSKNFIEDGLIRICPDEWYDNQMPGSDDSGEQRQYFLINGERRELVEFDVAWIRDNCEVNEPVAVY